MLLLAGPKKTEKFPLPAHPPPRPSSSLPPPSSPHSYSPEWGPSFHLRLILHEESPECEQMSISCRFPTSTVISSITTHQWTFKNTNFEIKSVPDRLSIVRLPYLLLLNHSALVVAVIPLDAMLALPALPGQHHHPLALRRLLQLERRGYGRLPYSGAIDLCGYPPSSTTNGDHCSNLTVLTHNRVRWKYHVIKR